MPEIPEIPESGPAQGYRVEFQVIAFVKGHHISPQRIEDAIIKSVQENEAFCLVRNLSVTRSDNHET